MLTNIHMNAYMKKYHFLHCQHVIKLKLTKKSGFLKIKLEAQLNHYENWGVGGEGGVGINTLHCEKVEMAVKIFSYCWISDESLPSKCHSGFQNMCSAWACPKPRRCSFQHVM